jgi:hypothetical protein
MPHFLQQHTPIPYLKSASEQHKVSSNPTSALIQANDGTDGIVLKSLPFADAAFTSIDAIKDTLINGSWDLSAANKIDVHATPFLTRTVLLCHWTKLNPLQNGVSSRIISTRWIMALRTVSCLSQHLQRRSLLAMRHYL